MAKAEPKRNVGREILAGLRQLKRGEHGRVVNVPSVASIRERTGFRRPSSPRCLAYRCALCKSGAGASRALRGGPHAIDGCG